MSTKTSTAPTAHLTHRVEVDETAVKFAMLASVRARKADLAKQESDLLADLAGVLGAGKHVIPGQGDITFRANNVYDPKVMADALRPGQFQRVSERKIVPARVKQLYPAVYEASRRYLGLVAGSVNFY